MTSKYRIVSGVSVTADTACWVRFGVSGPYTQLKFSTGLFFANGTGVSDDFVDIFHTLLQTFSVSIAFSLNVSTGLWSLVNSTAFPFTIAFTDPDNTSTKTSTIVRDYLRLVENPGDTSRTFSVGTTTATEVVHGSVYPNLYMLEDSPVWDARVRQGVPNDGPIHTMRNSYREGRKVTARLEGAYPRSLVFTEYNQWTRFKDRAGLGIPFQLYSHRDDSSASANPYNEDTNPRGYHNLVLDKKFASWTPEFPFSPNLAYTEDSFTGWPWIPRV